MKPVLVILALLLPAPAFAEMCEDLWFTRNLIMDRAGYCFGTALGKAVFDNSGCKGKVVPLAPSASTQVAAIRALERQNQCKVNTRAANLPLDDLAIRRKMRDLPVRDDFESACLGWRQGTTALRAGHDTASAAIGQVTNGDYLSLAHLPVGAWTYVTVTGPGWPAPKSGGWLELDKLGRDSCAQWAG